MFTCRSLMFDAQIHLDKFEDNSIERSSSRDKVPLFSWGMPGINWLGASLRWSRSRHCLWRQYTDCELWHWRFTKWSGQYFVSSTKGCSIRSCPPATSFSRVHSQESVHFMLASNSPPRPVLSIIRQYPESVWRPCYPCFHNLLQWLQVSMQVVSLQPSHNACLSVVIISAKRCLQYQNSVDDFTVPMAFMPSFIVSDFLCCIS